MRLNPVKFYLLTGLIALSRFSSLAQAAVSEVSFGFSLPTPLGNYNQVLNRPTGYQLELFYDSFGMGSNVDVHFQGQLAPYTVQGAPNSSLTVDGFFAGLSARAGKTVFNIIPFFATDLGLVYNSLSFSGFAQTSGNSSTALATQFVPGLDLPVYRDFGVTLELPIQFVFVKNTFVTWSSVFSLRYDL